MPLTHSQFWARIDLSLLCLYNSNSNQLSVHPSIFEQKVSFGWTLTCHLYLDSSWTIIGKGWTHRSRHNWVWILCIWGEANKWNIVLTWCKTKPITKTQFPREGEKERKRGKRMNEKGGDCDNIVLTWCRTFHRAHHKDKVFFHFDNPGPPHISSHKSSPPRKHQTHFWQDNSAPCKR